MKFYTKALFILLLSAWFAAPLHAAESLDQTIQYLLDYVANSHATFIRNGTSHTPAEAADHIRAKYEHFKDQIKTPQDFIRLSASKSLLTGKPYLVRTADGKEMRLDEWLTNALKAHRAAPHSGVERLQQFQNGFTRLENWREKTFRELFLRGGHKSVVKISVRMMERPAHLRIVIK